jgi:hypothetical protein
MVKNNIRPSLRTSLRQADPEPISGRGLENDLGLSVGEP